MRRIRTLWVPVCVLLILSLAFVSVTAAPGETTLIVDPEHNSGTVGSTFIIDLILYDVEDCFAWQVNMTWNTAVLNVSSDYLGAPYYTWIPRVTYGDFIVGPEGVTNVKLIDFNAGWFMVGQSILGEHPGLDGSGWLATIEMEVLQEASAVIDISSNYWLGGPPYATTTLQDSNLWEIPMMPMDGYFDVVSSPWPTDLNADGVIDIRDLARVAIKWGWSGTPGEIPEDVNDDGDVNITDLSMVAQQYGKHYA